MFGFLGPLIGAGASLLGNVLGMDAQKDAAEDANAAAAARDAANREAEQRRFDQNVALQREFAQMGLRWKVEDAKAAGLHPIFALGGAGASYTPTPYQHTDSSYVADNSGQYWGQMGQDISRALTATQTAVERTNDRMGALALERSELQNDLLRAQINKLNGQVGPAFPQLGKFEWEEPKVTTTVPGTTEHAAGPAMPTVQWLDYGNKISAQPAPNVKVEDEFGAPLMAEWWANNKLWPDEKLAPPESVWRQKWPTADGVKWSWTSFGWIPYYYNGSRAISQGEPLGEGNDPFDWRTAARYFHQGKKAYRDSNYHGSPGFDYWAP